MMAKTRLGCLPIRIETGRYSIPKLPESERKCLVCKNLSQSIDYGPLDGPNSGPVESEIHYLFTCGAYKTERDIWYDKMTLPPDFNLLSVESKLKIVLNDPCNVKATSIFITNAYNTRSKILN